MYFFTIFRKLKANHEIVHPLEGFFSIKGFSGCSFGGQDCFCSNSLQRSVFHEIYQGTVPWFRFISKSSWFIYHGHLSSEEHPWLAVRVSGMDICSFSLSCALSHISSTCVVIKFHTNLLLWCEISVRKLLLWDVKQLKWIAWYCVSWIVAGIIHEVTFRYVDHTGDVQTAAVLLAVGRCFVKEQCWPAVHSSEEIASTDFELMAVEDSESYIDL